MLYWGDIGAGFALTSEDSILLTLRSSNVMNPYTWSIPGGSINQERYLHSERIETVSLEEEAILAGAIQEVEEELGNLPLTLYPYDKVIYKDKGFRFITFFAEIPSEIKKSWKPDFDRFEVSQVKWFRKDSLSAWKQRRPLHFGVDYLLRQRPTYFQKSPD